MLSGLYHRTTAFIPGASDVGIANQELVHLRAQHSVSADNTASFDAVGIILADDAVMLHA